jgi:hypothetical protein
MNDDPNISCSNCRFYFSRDGHADGECRKNAPRPAVVNINTGMHQYNVVFPKTNDLLWCGEFAEYNNVSNKVLTEESVI